MWLSATFFDAGTVWVLCRVPVQKLTHDHASTANEQRAYVRDAFHTQPLDIICVVHLSCVYRNSVEKSTLYKHSGPLIHFSAQVL